jgi:hypothetical protein
MVGRLMKNKLNKTWKDAAAPELEEHKAVSEENQAG